MSFFDRIFPGLRDSRRELASKRPPHFRLLAGLAAPDPGTLADLGSEEAERINAQSRRYFDRDDLREFWINKPFSDPAWTGWMLSRFGHLLTSLDLRPGDRVLDFGCGTGWSSDMLARMGMDVVGMDIAPAALEMAREASARRAAGAPGGQPRFEVYSGDRLEYPDGHFDAVVVFDAFHHLPNPQRVLAEFCRVLAPNCRLGMAEPGVGHSDQRHSLEEMSTGVLEREIDLERLYRSGLTAGFRSLEAVIPGLHPHAVTLPMRRLRWYLRGLSWLLPANHVRLALLGAPIVLLWKGPYFISSLHPRDQSAMIRPAVRTVSCRPGESLTLDTEVTNTNATVWLREGRHGRGYVRLGAHLLGADGRMIDADFARASLPNDLPTHGRARVALALTAPATAGRYVLRLDMVNEGIGWFAEGKSETADVEINAVGSGR
jgi:SAM-dependent methyltransferase